MKTLQEKFKNEFGRHFTESELQFAIELIKETYEKGYEKGIRETALKIDKKNIEYMKSGESDSFLKQIKDYYYRKGVEDALGKIPKPMEYVENTFVVDCEKPLYNQRKDGWNGCLEESRKNISSLLK